jgi:hypothetical protein
MKKYTTIIVCLLTYISNAQVKLVEINENSKSGNYKDILTSFYQLAVKDFSGEEKSIGFNSTLFALKSKADPNLLKDKDYIEATFSRNFQFNFKVDLNKDFKYAGFTGGISYAPINNRDRTLANFRGTPLETKYTDLSGFLSTAQVAIGNQIILDATISDKKKTLELLQDAVDEILDYKSDLSSIENPYINKILGEIDSQIAAKGYVDTNMKAITNSSGLMAHLNELSEDYYKELQSKGLLTITTDGTSNESGKFNKASFGIAYLKGNKEAWNEIDLRAKLVYADTLVTDHLPRTAFNAKVGWNFKFGNDYKKQSYLEIKAVAEYNKIFNNLLPDEEEEVYSGNAEIRIRITDDLWIPFIVKYDIEKANFLGFLNVTYNLEGFK